MTSEMVTTQASRAVLELDGNIPCMLAFLGDVSAPLCGSGYMNNFPLLDFFSLGGIASVTEFKHVNAHGFSVTLVVCSKAVTHGYRHE
jgi:hypothetical protein